MQHFGATYVACSCKGKLWWVAKRYNMYFKRNICQGYQKENWNQVTDRVSMATMRNYDVFRVSYLLCTFVLLANGARPGQTIQYRVAWCNNSDGFQT